MPINPDIRDQAYQFFIEEAPELLQAIEDGLLLLKQEKSPAKVHDVMRAAHSIKGGAASVELEAIATLAHRLENIFKALYSESLEIDTDLETQLLWAYDCLRLPLLEQIQSGSFDPEQAVAFAEPIFVQIEERLGDALTQADSYMPSSADLGVDMTRSIFEVDVAEGLERLGAVLAYPQGYEVAGELRAQAEVFAGFAELLNLPEFAAIAQTTLRAVETHPNQALEITQLAYADFERARLAVLEGTGLDNISPSPDLVAFTESDTAAVSNIPSVPVSEFTPELESSINPEDSAIPSLEDIFGGVLDMSEVEGSEFAISEELHRVDQEEELEADWAIASLSETQTDDTVDFELIEVESNSEEQDAVPSSAIVPVTPALPSHLESQFEEIEAIEIPQTLEARVQQIEQLFDRLPPLVSEEAAQNADLAIPNQRVKAPNSYRKQSPTSKSEASPTPGLSVRVDLERLGRMNNLVGELAINRNGLSLQNEQLQGSVRELLNRFSRVQNLVGYLRKLSDQMLIAPERRSDGTIPHSLNQFRELRLVRSDFDDFDSLELDSYGVVHSQLQGLLEEMMQLEESVDDIVLFAKATDQTLERQRQMLTQLRDELMWARMLPLGEVINRFPRMLRDLSASYHKPARLKLSGTGVLVDKAVLEKLYDPLLHLIRNAFDHGIESPQVRRQQGKPEQGLIEIRAYHRGSQTIIEVRDDGQGLNLERIRQQAVELGLLSPDQLAMMANNRLFNLIFEPGFSTAREVSELSGRGVGLDVVRSQLRSLKGTIGVSSETGVGTTFTLRLPLTLTIAKLLVCFSGSIALALPSDSIEEIVIPRTEQLKKSGTKQFLHWRSEIVPTHRLSDLLDYACPLPDTSPSRALLSVPTPDNWARPLLILRQEQNFLALEIDRLVTEQELVIKPFGAVIAPPSFTYGCTILGDGSVIPVIDATALLEQLLSQSATASAIISGVNAQATANESVMPEKVLGNKTKVEPKTVKTPTVLVVDDAVALRRTLALSLERAGIRVLQARDGREALERLQQSSFVELIICDIEMPNMNGFEFLSHRRQNPQFSQIPVVMLTSRSNDKHRWLAMQLGANAYFTKPYLEQEFLGAIKQLMSQRQLEQVMV
jgi:chemotaxis family two-component system sensor histidine kinase/response regulator PixL